MITKIKKVAILGVGFMAGSLALRLKEVYPEIIIYGYARNKKSYDKLEKLNILDNVDQSLTNVLEDADLIVLGAPIFAIIDYFKKIAPSLKPGCIVIDLGSSKELIEKSAKKILPKDVFFVGCHPLCGSDKKSAEFSKSNIYKEAICIITSLPKKEESKIICNLWQKLGTKVVFMPSNKHDKMLSALSHLPHVIAFALVNLAPSYFKDFPLQSFRDLTRIANSPANIWQEIFLSNRVNLCQDIRAFINVLEQMESFIKNNKEEKLSLFIKKVNQKYNSL